MAASDLDYDDIICQNILIRKEEAEDASPTVEVVTKQNENYETLYNRQAAMYRMEENVNTYLETSLHEEGSEQGSETEGSDYEVVIKQSSKHALSDDDEPDSSDSDWEVTKKPRNSNKMLFECNECDKKCATKRGLDMHKRSHARQRAREHEPPADVGLVPLPSPQRDENDDAPSSPIAAESPTATAEDSGGD